jgi:hypothetical protein
MKPNRYFVPFGMLLFLILCFVPSGQAQQGTPLNYSNAPAQLALSWTFNSSSGPTAGFSVAGLRYWQLAFVPIGTVSACGISLDSSVGSGYSTGGILPSATIGSCASAAEFVSSATTPTQFGQLTPSITGAGSVLVILLGYANNPGASGSASSSITSPLDGSGFVEVNCKTGCSGGSGGASAADESAFTQGTSSLTPIGGIYSTSITSLTTGQVGAVQVTADRNLFVNLNKLAGTALGAPSNYGTSPGAVEVPGMNAFVTNTVAHNLTQLAGSALGAPSNYGTSPGAVAVPGFNAFVTNIPAVTQSGTWNQRVSGNAGGIFDAAAGATAAANSLEAGLVYNSTPPTPSTGQQEPLQGDSSANLKVNCVTGCSSSGGSSLADEGSFTQGTTSFTPIGGFYNSSPTPLTSGQGGAAQLTADRSIFTNINKVGGVAVSLYATLFSAQAATGTATSSAVRIPGSNGYGTLWITGASITGSPSGCQVALAYQPNTGSPASSAQATISFTPGNSTQGLAVAPTLPSGDQYVGTYSCGTYPTAGTISVVFDPSNALPPNQSVNLAQIGGTAPVIDPCGANAGSQATINLTASGQVITGTSSKQTYICGLDVVTATAQNIALVEGTGSTCGTSTAGMAGGATAATGWNFAANGGLVKGVGGNWVYKTATAADNVCLLLSGTGQTSGEIRYVQQ